MEQQQSQPTDFRFSMAVTSKWSASAVHVHNLQIAEIFFQARNRYITDAVGLSWPAIFASGRNLIMRRLAIDFEREASVNDDLVCGVRARWRSRRSLTFEEVVFAGDWSGWGMDA